MGNSGRFGRSSDRAAHPGRGELVFAGVAAGPAGQALKARRERFRVGQECDALAADRHLADRHRPPAIRGLAGLQHRKVLADRRRSRRRSHPEGAIRSGGEGQAHEGGERDGWAKYEQQGETSRESGTRVTPLSEVPPLERAVKIGRFVLEWQGCVSSGHCPDGLAHSPPPKTQPAERR
jgi:hypothetical protein